MSVPKYRLVYHEGKSHVSKKLNGPGLDPFSRVIGNGQEPM